MTHAASHIVDSDTPQSSTPSWSDGSPVKGIKLDLAATRLCKAVASHIKFSQGVDEVDARRSVLVHAHDFNEQAPKAERTLKGLWRRLEPLVKLKRSSVEGRCVDLTCGGVPHIVECVSCFTIEIAFCNNRDGSGQFAVDPNDPEGKVFGLCRACLPQQMQCKPNSCKVAKKKAEGVRALHRRKTSVFHSDTGFTIPAHEKRRSKFDRRTQGHERRQGHSK